ncbi:MAG: sensor histidine kinase [Actinobacteria bacterium]|nr:sensor histidine kinase [Actinomycetota bacterium]
MNNNTDYNRFLSDLNITAHLKVEEDLGSGYVRLKISEAERRQALQDIKCIEDIVLECLRNSRDAKSKNIFIATKKISDKTRHLYIIDDGAGIPDKFHKLIFQSRVTSKLENAVRDPYGFHGRGMALFSIKLNVEKICISYSGPAKGTAIFIEADTGKITEKKDQSAMPVIKKNPGSITIEGGVNNIARILMEFSLQNPDINIFYGSPTQIVSTMIANSKFNKNACNIKDLKEIISRPGLKITDFVAIASNYAILGQVLKEYFNMNISERAIQRIFYGEIQQLNSFKVYLDMFLRNESASRISLNKAGKTALKDDNAFVLQDCKNKDLLTGKVLNDNNDNLSLCDELGLVKRFKDEEIRYIIDILKKEINKTGSRYFIEAAENVEITKQNNTLNLKINLKQKN